MSLRGLRRGSVEIPKQSPVKWDYLIEENQPFKRRLLRYARNDMKRGGSEAAFFALRAECKFYGSVVTMKSSKVTSPAVALAPLQVMRPMVPVV